MSCARPLIRLAKYLSHHFILEIKTKLRQQIDALSGIVVFVIIFLLFLIITIGDVSIRAHFRAGQ
jgi:hypothetical protein